MKQFHKNPRQITTKQYSDLETWLKKYGDLSGVVHDLNSDQVIGGNQRSRIFNINECKIVMLEEYPQPDEQGTVGWGFIIWQGKKYSYRQVRWTEEVCDQANLIANKAGGTFDFDVLANQFELSTVLSGGFEKWELGFGGFDPNNLIDAFGRELSNRSEYTDVTLVFTRENGEKIKKTIKKEGMEAFCSRVMELACDE